MAGNFDPYLHWLGIRDPQRPPNHYRLLGVELFEGDLDVIANAADRQMAHVRTFQTGPRSAESQRLLNELAAAKVCLLNPQKKVLYDTRLRAGLAVGGMSVASGPTERGAPTPVPPPIPFRRGRRPALLWVGLSVLVAVGVVLAALLALSLVGRGSRETEPTVVASSGLPSEPPGAGSGSLAAGESGEGPSRKAETPSAVAGKTNAGQSSPAPAALATAKAPKPGERPPGEPAKTAPPSAGPAKVAAGGTKSEAKTKPKPPPEPLPPAGQSTEPAPKAPKAMNDRGTVGAKSAKPAEKAGFAKPVERLPVPDVAAQKAAKSEVREVYRARFAQAKSPIDKGLLAGELLRQATETKDNPAIRYVLLAEARDLAVAGGDSARLREAVLEMASGYEVDALQEQTRVLSEAAEAALPSLVRNSLARTAVGLAQEAIQVDAFEAAGQLAKAGFSLASKAIASKGRDLQTIRQATELSENIPWYKQQHDLAQAAEKALREDGGNAKAILFLGKYYGLVKDQWARGLPLLVKSGEPTLKAVAEAEIALGEAPEPSEMTKLADQWMAAVPAVEEPMQRLVRRHALYWYETALPRLSGFTQSRVARVVQDLKEGEKIRRKP